ncbi:Vitamin B12 ABC transporter, permease protein BtuC [Brevinematales bacterium NS]|nr:Vitamin B12 ABC transporter, permease protein BtuC [Brevinematales bacterium NS]
MDVSWKRSLWVFVLTMAILITGSVLSLGWGPSAISPREVVTILVGRGEGLSRDIVWKIRFPRWILGLAVGGALSVAGGILQSLFANPLVEPYTLGISGGATLGVCLGLVFGKMIGYQGGLFWWSLAGGLGFMGILYGLSRRRIFSGSTILLSDMLLFGLMLSFLSSGLVMLFLALARAADLHHIVFWTMGSLEQGGMVNPAFVWLVVAGGVGIVWLFSREMDAFLLGEEEALFLGVPVHRMKKLFFLVAVVLTAMSIASAGLIGFVGLLVPNVYKRLLPLKHRLLVPLFFLGGGGFLALCDFLARVVIAPLELPVGVITGILGGLLFLWMLFQEKRG